MSLFLSFFSLPDWGVISHTGRLGFSSPLSLDCGLAFIGGMGIWGLILCWVESLVGGERETRVGTMAVCWGIVEGSCDSGLSEHPH